MDRVTSPTSSSSSSSSLDNSYTAEHCLAPSHTTNTIKKLPIPQMRQSQQSDEPSAITPASPSAVRHQMGSVSLKRRGKEKSEASNTASAELSSILKNMSAKSLIDTLMNFNTVNHDGQIMQWDTWLKSHGVSDLLLGQLKLQAELIDVLRLSLSPPSLTKDTHGNTASLAIADSRQRRQLCAQILADLKQSPLCVKTDDEKTGQSDEAKTAITTKLKQQVIFLADAAKAAHPDLNKIFKYQLPKILCSAVWPEKFDEQKLRVNLETMGLFGILSDVLVSVVKLARLATTESMAGMQEDVLSLLKQTLQADLSDLVLLALKHATTNLLMYAQEREHTLQITRLLLTHLYALLDQQLAAIRQALGLPLKR